MDGSATTNALRPGGMGDMPRTLPAALLRNAGTRAAAPACRQKRLGIWQTWTWAEVAREVLTLAIGIEAEGVEAGDTVAVMGPPTPQLGWAIVAAQTLGAVPVPVAPDVSDAELRHILNGTRPTVAIVRGQDEVARLLGLDPDLHLFPRIIHLDRRGLRDAADPRLVSWERLRAIGQRAPISDLAVRIGRLRPQQAAMVLHTAGVRGMPKALVFSHAALLEAGRAAVALYGLDAREEVLAALPDAWPPAFLLGPVLSLLAGFPLSYPESDETVLQDLREIGPTFLFGPPVLFKHLHTTIYARMAPAGPTRRRLFEGALAALKQERVPDAGARKLGIGGRLRAVLARPLIAWPLMDVLGLSRVRTALVFGDRLPDAIADDFAAFGLALGTVYSPTEGAGFVAAEGRCRPTHREAGVGAPVAGAEVRIAPDGEIQFRGPATFMAQVGSAVRTADEWIGTGDAGTLGAGGSMQVLGRLADDILLPGGHRINAAAVEVLLRGFPQIRDAVVSPGAWAGDLCVLISLDATAITAWAEQQRLGHAGLDELAASPEVRALIEACVARVNDALARRPGQPCIRRISVLDRPLSLADGELTRDHKVRRDTVLERLLDARGEPAGQRGQSPRPHAASAREHGSAAAQPPARTVATPHPAPELRRA